MFRPSEKMLNRLSISLIGGVFIGAAALLGGLGSEIYRNKTCYINDIVSSNRLETCVSKTLTPVETGLVFGGLATQLLSGVGLMMSSKKRNSVAEI